MKKEVNLLRDGEFLRQLDLDNNKKRYVRIIILSQDEKPIRSIEGEVTGGSISVTGNSPIRRAGSITFVAENKKNDLTDVNNLLSINKKIKILIGIENHINNVFEDIVWFKQGIFVIASPSITHNASGVTVTLQLKDKMCLLNGENGGGLPASIIFDSYDQIMGKKELGTNENLPKNPNDYTVYKKGNNYYKWNSAYGWEEASESNVGQITSVPQKIFDIIQTLVCNYGNEPLNNIIINDVPYEIKNIVRNTSSNELYYNDTTQRYSYDYDTVLEGGDPRNVVSFGYNEDCGYIYTGYTYPGELISGIGETVTSVLDKIKNVLGNFEYFYDIDGRFVFREIKNYLNNTYVPVDISSAANLLDNKNCFMDLSHSSQSVYTFDNGSALVSSYTNNPKFTNIKNDFHIWGKNKDGYCIHYHVAIKKKPQEPFATRQVVFEVNEDQESTGRIRLPKPGEESVSYEPTDWRAELYLRGLEKQKLQQRPDVYEQEILDLFDSIYDMQEKKFKGNPKTPTDLTYWIDYILPAKMQDISIDSIGQKRISHQQDKIVKLYNPDIPDNIMIDSSYDDSVVNLLKSKCADKGNSFSNVSHSVYQNIGLGTVGYNAQEVARDLLYKHTNYAVTISISSIPILYLDVNTRITVRDFLSGISGDYIINSINVPLAGNGTMSISATKVYDRI